MIRILAIAMLLVSSTAFASADGQHHPVHDRLMHIGLTIRMLTILTYLGDIAKQPLIFAYLAAGALLGPNFGLGLISSEKDISTISELDLVLLLFMIGIETDLRKLTESAKWLSITDISQFACCHRSYFFSAHWLRAG